MVRKEHSVLHQSKGFTLVELLVVISIIALLLSILMPALGRARKQALAVACAADLHSWGLIFAMYTGDNNGSFGGSYWGTDVDPSKISLWMKTLRPYYPAEKGYCCPAATKPATVTEPLSCKPKTANEAWGKMEGGYWSPDGKPIYGSLGVNEWIYDNKNRTTIENYFWRRTQNIRTGGDIKVPIMFDCLWPNVWPLDADTAPKYKLAWVDNSPFMWRVCVDRHNGAAINVMYADNSISRLKLKELWTLKWHRQFDTTKKVDFSRAWFNKLK
jgi:prepilin-type N-terminal cleavage/methylation domain-containing protein